MSEQAQRVFPAPGTNVENQPFWDAAAAGKFLVKHCAACGKTHYYPRALCPHCLSADTQWRESAGQGTIYSYSVTRRAGPIPFGIAYVTLDEGPTMLTNIADCDLDAVKIGDKVQVVFKATDGGPPVPMFKPA